jgi:hypothetical protein
VHVPQALADAGKAVQSPSFRRFRKLTFVIEAFGQPYCLP